MDYGFNHTQNQRRKKNNMRLLRMWEFTCVLMVNNRHKLCKNISMHHTKDWMNEKERQNNSNDRKKERKEENRIHTSNKNPFWKIIVVCCCCCCCCRRRCWIYVRFFSFVFIFYNTQLITVVRAELHLVCFVRWTNKHVHGSLLPFLKVDDRLKKNSHFSCNLHWIFFFFWFCSKVVHSWAIFLKTINLLRLHKKQSISKKR